MNALIFGGSGGLAGSLAEVLVARGSRVDLVTRAERREKVREFHSGAVRVHTVETRYSEFEPTRAYEAYFFTQAVFSPTPLRLIDDAAIQLEVEVGLTDPICLTRKLLTSHPPLPTERRNYCYIGSTSAYAGFKNTAIYCAVKHGLLGFVRAMNDEYEQSDTRFWLFSMGTMNTEMGSTLTQQDSTTFLQPTDVAERIVGALSSPSNLFEPEVLIRRRVIRFLER